MPFQHFVVFEFEPHPQPFRPRTAGKGLAAGRFEVPEFADKVHRLDVLKIDRHHVARGVQEFEFAFADEIGRGHVSIDRIPVHLADYDFFVG